MFCTVRSGVLENVSYIFLKAKAHDREVTNVVWTERCKRTVMHQTPQPSTEPNHHTWLVHCKKGATLGGVSVHLCTHRRPGWRECSETQPRTHAPERRDTKQNVTSLHPSATAYRPDNPFTANTTPSSACRYHSILCVNTTPFCVLIPLHSVC